MSRFVSGGTNDEPTERDEAWLKAQQEIEENRRKKAELEKRHDGKSLYEVLQENKGPYVRCARCDQSLTFLYSEKAGGLRRIRQAQESISCA